MKHSAWRHRGVLLVLGVLSGCGGAGGIETGIPANADQTPIHTDMPTSRSTPAARSKKNVRTLRLLKAKASPATPGKPASP
ncbi:hypothetical protein ACYOEI_06680 [Singulisphaera rosea]